MRLFSVAGLALVLLGLGLLDRMVSAEIGAGGSSADSW